MQKVERSVLAKATVAGGCCKSGKPTLTGSVSNSSSSSTVTVVIGR